MPRTNVDRFRRIISLVHRGLLSVDEVVSQFLKFVADDPEKVPAFLSELNSDMTSKLRQVIERAPVTDEQWERALRIFGGFFGRPHTAEEWQEIQTEWKRRDRIAIEAVRRYWAEEAVSFEGKEKTT